MLEIITQHYQNKTHLWTQFHGRVLDATEAHVAHIMVRRYPTGAVWLPMMEYHLQPILGGFWVQVRPSPMLDEAIREHIKPFNYLLGFHLWEEVMAWHRNYHRHGGGQVLLPQLSVLSTEWVPVKIDPYSDEPYVI